MKITKYYRAKVGINKGLWICTPVDCPFTTKYLSKIREHVKSCSINRRFFN